MILSVSKPAKCALYGGTYKSILDKQYKEKFFRKILRRYPLIHFPMTGVTDTRSLIPLQVTKYDHLTQGLRRQ
jgi:hypothetical protein